MLPPGTRNLREIEREDDPIHRVRDLATLLEYLLRTLEPGALNSEGKPLGLAERIERHRDKFTRVDSVWFSIRIRNSLVHGGRDDRAHVTADEIEDASRNFQEAIEDVLEHVPHHVHRDASGADMPVGRAAGGGRLRRLLTIGAVLLALATAWAWTGGPVPVLARVLHAPRVAGLLASVEELAVRAEPLADTCLAGRLDVACEAWRDGERLHGEGSWREALEELEASRTQLLELLEAGPTAERVETLGDELERDRRAAFEVRASEFAATSWEAGEARLAEASAARHEGDPARAEAALLAARDAFREAHARAREAVDTRSAGTVYAGLVRLLGPEALARNGGDSWRAAREAAATAEARQAEGDLAAARASMETAVQHLAELVDAGMPATSGAAVDPAPAAELAHLASTWTPREPGCAAALQRFAAQLPGLLPREPGAWLRAAEARLAADVSPAQVVDTWAEACRLAQLSGDVAFRRESVRGLRAALGDLRPIQHPDYPFVLTWFELASFATAAGETEAATWAVQQLAELGPSLGAQWDYFWGYLCAGLATRVGRPELGQAFRVGVHQCRAPYLEAVAGNYQVAFDYAAACGVSDQFGMFSLLAWCSLVAGERELAEKAFLRVSAGFFRDRDFRMPTGLWYVQAQASLASPEAALESARRLREAGLRTRALAWVGDVAALAGDEVVTAVARGVVDDSGVRRAHPLSAGIAAGRSLPASFPVPPVAEDWGPQELALFYVGVRAAL